MTNRPAWLAEPALQQFLAATRDAGGDARAVGGAVRDFLLGVPSQDIDLASSLPPDKTMEIAQAQGWKAIPTGIAHGTVTLVLPNRILEVTTLRRDVQTDGRRATVAFTDRFEEDAARRDFTFNALYMDAQGTITDFFGGQEDLRANRVRFIGDAATRIREDGLRILRYFRFLAVHAAAPPDAETLAALATHKEMLANLSGERIAAEMHRLLSARNPVPALEAMAQIGLAQLLTHTAWRVDRCARLVAVETHHHTAHSPWARLLSMIDIAARAASAVWIGERWKLSRTERAELEYLAQQVDIPSAAALKEWLRHESRPLVEARLALAVVDHAAPPQAEALFALAHTWQVPRFDVTARDLLLLGFSAGVKLGETLRALEAQWAASDYRLNKEALLANLVPQKQESSERKE